MFRPSFVTTLAAAALGAIGSSSSSSPSPFTDPDRFRSLTPGPEGLDRLFAPFSVYHPIPPRFQGPMPKGRGIVGSSWPRPGQRGGAGFTPWRRGGHPLGKGTPGGSSRRARRRRSKSRR